MPRVSVGSVENLRETLSAVARACESVDVESEQLYRVVALKVEEVRAENEHSEKLLEESIELEKEAQIAVANAKEDLEHAHEHLSDANAALSRCEWQDDEDDGNAPDCSYEENALEDAEREVHSATEFLFETQQSLDLAIQLRMRMSQRVEIAKQAEQHVSQLAEKVEIHGRDIRSQTEQLSKSGQSRLNEAHAALETYLATSEATAMVAGYLNWSPTKGAVVSPRMIADRLSLSTPQCAALIQYWSDREPRFRAKLAGYRQRLDNCHGASERLAVQLKIRQNLAGEVAERLVVQAFAPLGDYSRTQTRRVLDDGRATIVDFNLENLRVPVVLGKGERMGASVGESLAVEVKCGKPSYLLRQRDHMTFQARGHRNANASMTICSRDIKDLMPEEEESLRKDLRDAGSAMVGMLPRKSEIDQACWEAVNSIDVKGDWK